MSLLCPLYKIILLFFICSFFWPSNFLQITNICFVFIHFFHQFGHCSCSSQRMYVPSCCLHLTNPLPLPRSNPLSLTFLKPQFRYPNSLFMVTGHRPVAQPRIWRSSAPYLLPQGQGGPAIPPGTGCHFSCLLQPAWAAVGLFFSPVATRGIVRSLVYNPLDVSISEKSELSPNFHIICK